MKIGILGGTFDPPHIGHLIMAEEAYTALSLDKVFFVPAKEPPHKRDRHYSDIEDRLIMVRMSIADNPHFAISLVDVERPGPSYSVDTIALLQKELGPEADLFFIVGMDSAADLVSWREPAKLVSMCKVVAVVRPEFKGFDLRSLEPSIPDASKRIQVIDAPLIGISSSDIRHRAERGLPIKYQVTKEVEHYILQQELYRRGTS